MTKILFLSVMNGAAWGGSEELWYQSALWTAANGFEVGVCCFASEGKQTQLKELEKAGCKLFLLPAKEETKKQPLLGKIKLSKSVAEVPFEYYDKVIVNQGGWKDVTHGPFKKLYRRLKKYVLLYHNYNVNEKFSFQKFTLLQKWADKADKNLGATLKIFETLGEAYSLNIKNHEVLFNPLTFTPPATVTPYTTTTEKKIFFSMLAALDTERKAQDVLLNTLSMEKWKKRNWELNLYGEGKDKPMLEKMIVTLQLEQKVFLKGYTSDVKKAIADSHLILQITHMDAMPITIIEAIALSRPAIVSNAGDMPLWIQENNNGWVTDNVGIEAIDMALEEAWNQRPNLYEMGKRSFQLFQKNFPANPIEYFLKQAGILS